MAKTAGAGIMKFAGTIGIAVGTSEAFMKTIRGSQTTSDEFDAQMRTCQTSVNEFFTSLSTGDFTYFLGGLDSIISKSRDAYAALDQLGNARISYDYFREDFNAAMAESRSVAMDNEAPKEQREAALGVWAKAIEDKKKKAESVKSDALTALKAVVVEGNLLHSDDITLEDVDKAFSYDVAGKDRDSLKSAVANRYDTYKIKYAELERRKKSGGIADWAFPESKESKDRAAFNDFIASKQAELNKEYKDAIIFNDLLVKKKDEELIKVGQLGKEYKQINQELANDKKTFDRVRDRVNKPKKNPKENEEKKPLKDTLSWYDAEISRLNKKLSKETTMQARATVQAAINELEKKKVNIKIVVEQEVFKGKYGDMKGGLPSINRPGDQLGLKHNDTGFKLSKFESPIKKKDIDLNKLYAESLGSIANSFGSMTSMKVTFSGDNHTLDILGGYNKITVKDSNYPVGNLLPDEDFKKDKKLLSRLNSRLDRRCYRKYLYPKNWDMFLYNEGKIITNKDLELYAYGAHEFEGGILERYCNYKIEDGKPDISDYSFTDVIQIKWPKERYGNDAPNEGGGKVMTIKGAAAVYSTGIFCVSGSYKFINVDDMIPWDNSSTPTHLYAQIRIGSMYYGSLRPGAGQPNEWAANPGYTFKLDYDRTGAKQDYYPMINQKTLDMPYSGVTGVIIPIDRVLRGDFEFTLLTPIGQSFRVGGVLVKGFKLSYHRPDDDETSDNSDRTYENVVNEDYINELDEIEFKISSYNNDGACYSKVMLGDNYLTDNLYSSIEQKLVRPEEHLIRRIINQYGATKFKLTQILVDDEAITPITTITDKFQPNKRFTITGGTIDFAMNQFNCKMIENGRY